MKPCGFCQGTNLSVVICDDGYEETFECAYCIDGQVPSTPEEIAEGKAAFDRLMTEDAEARNRVDLRSGD